jgi:hypothetical protein
MYIGSRGQFLKPDVQVVDDAAALTAQRRTSFAARVGSEILSRHSGGSMTALDRNGGGTIMRVTLPGAATRAEPPPPTG